MRLERGWRQVLTLVMRRLEADVFPAIGHKPVAEVTAPSRDVRPGTALQARRKTHYARVDARELPELLRKTEACASR